MEYRGKSDIGGGMTVEDNLIIYTNTGGEIKAANTSNGEKRVVVPNQGKNLFYSHCI